MKIPWEKKLQRRTRKGDEVGNNPSMFKEFKNAMAQEFEMTDIGLMSYYLGIEVKQRDDSFFISQEGYAK
ncbi:hypothetical protein RJ640_004162 [Escallonia rubra]|uniref:Reverse transcriptase Ty1/copia-type domain-containing protein n=1 Tax=Escallonia rubra TaxID=112253 RepID=A0AA88TY52_9ASTE|nr:hypothetical protein RJ640_004162 [Escallonia rubra]